MKIAKENPLISIVVPVYNVELYLEDAVNSLLNQTYDKIEIILVDDKSSDKSGQICDSFACQHEKVRVVHKKENQGLGMARNTGIEHSKGQYIAFVDSDDFVDEDYIEIHLNHLLDSSADASYCGHIKFNQNGQTIFPNTFGGKTFNNNEIINSVIPQMCGRLKNSEQLQMSSCMAIYKTKIISENEIRFSSEREYISEDFLFNIDYLMKCERVVFISEVGYHYRYNEKSLTHTYLEDRFYKQKIMTKKVIEVTQQIGNYDLCKDRIINTFLIWVRACIQMEQKQACINGRKYSILKMYKICSDEMVQDILNNRNNSDKFTSELINSLIRMKLCHLLFALMAIKNKNESTGV